MKIYIILALTLVSCSKPKTNSCDEPIRFNQIEHILNNKCNSCHTSSVNYGDFNTYDGVMEKVDDGSFKYRVDNNTMPPTDKLTESEMNQIICWLEQGSIR